jgi:hypothetical protein
MKLIRRSIYCVRKKHFPTLPSNYDESLQQLSEMKQTLSHKGNQFFFQVTIILLFYLLVRITWKYFIIMNTYSVMELLRMRQNISCNCIQFMFIQIIIIYLWYTVFLKIKHQHMCPCGKP